MFTGIIEATATVIKTEQAGSNLNITLSCSFTSELKIDQSVAHNGCCLTVVDIAGDTYVVNAVEETLKKTNLKYWQPGSIINVERCMKLGDRLDGHIVQGHVDKVAKLTNIENKDGSYYLSFEYEKESGFVTVPQGSVTVNGISLTVASSREAGFSVAIIPYTWEFTNLKYLQLNDLVNLEFDVIGKYVSRLMAQPQK